MQGGCIKIQITHDFKQLFLENLPQENKVADKTFLVIS